MLIWRISNFTDLGGIGGERASGRWHRIGTRIVYCADHPALALLEVLVHLDYDDIPKTYQWLRIDAPDALAIERVEADATDIDACRAAGQAWLERRSTALARVASVIVPAAHNILVNPRHPDATQLRIVERIPWPFDPRLRGRPAA